MIDRVDLLIAVIGIVASVMGSSTALWLALSKKADQEDVRRLEDRLDIKIDGVEHRLNNGIDGVEDRLTARIGHLEDRLDTLETRVGTGFSRLESKLDALILRFVPEAPPPER